jgi:hypothetical protein
MRLQQVVEPGSPGAFFKSDVQVSAQSIEKLQNHAGFRFDHTFHHDLAGSISDRNRNAFLVHIHTDIFSADHWGVPPLERLSEHSNLLHKGRPFIRRRVIGKVPSFVKMNFGG